MQRVPSACWRLVSGPDDYTALGINSYKLGIDLIEDLKILQSTCTISVYHQRAGAWCQGLMIIQLLGLWDQQMVSERFRTSVLRSVHSNFRNRFQKYRKSEEEKKKKSLYNHLDLMAIITLELRHYQNPESFFKEFMTVVDLKDEDLCQEQEEIQCLKKKVSDLEEKLAEKETQKKCFSCMSVQTEDEEVSEILSSENPNSDTGGLLTDRFSLHTDKVSATDDTRFVKHATGKAADAPQKPKGKQIRKISKKSVFQSSSMSKTPSVANKMPKTPSVPKTSSKQTIFSAQDFRSAVCPLFINSFKHKSSCTKKRKQMKELKKVWVQKKASPEPKRIKQVWVIKGKFAQSEMLITEELREMFWNQKSKRKKRRVQKFEDGVYSPTNQRYHQVLMVTITESTKENDKSCRRESLSKRARLQSFSDAIYSWAPPGCIEEKETNSHLLGSRVSQGANKSYVSTDKRKDLPAVSLIQFKRFLENHASCLSLSPLDSSSMSVTPGYEKVKSSRVRKRAAADGYLHSAWHELLDKRLSQPGPTWSTSAKALLIPLLFDSSPTRVTQVKVAYIGTTPVLPTKHACRSNPSPEVSLQIGPHLLFSLLKPVENETCVNVSHVPVKIKIKSKRTNRLIRRAEEAHQRGELKLYWELTSNLTTEDRGRTWANQISNPHFTSLVSSFVAAPIESHWSTTLADPYLTFSRASPMLCTWHRSESGRIVISRSCPLDSGLRNSLADNVYSTPVSQTEHLMRTAQTEIQRNTTLSKRTCSLSFPSKTNHEAASRHPVLHTDDLDSQVDGSNLRYYAGASFSRDQTDMDHQLRGSNKDYQYYLDVLLWPDAYGSHQRVPSACWLLVSGPDDYTALGINSYKSRIDLFEDLKIFQSACTISVLALGVRA
ncbi:hypothetical protein LXL04_020143 [Taraxacum kok-saghyz]